MDNAEDEKSKLARAFSNIVKVFAEEKLTIAEAMQILDYLKTSYMMEGVKKSIIEQILKEKDGTSI